MGRRCSHRLRSAVELCLLLGRRTGFRKLVPTTQLDVDDGRHRYVVSGLSGLLRVQRRQRCGGRWRRGEGLHRHDACGGGRRRGVADAGVVHPHKPTDAEFRSGAVEGLLRRPGRKTDS